MTEKSMVAEGSIATGCRFFAECPIAPAKLRTLAEANLGDKRLIDHVIQIINKSQNIKTICLDRFHQSQASWSFPNMSLKDCNENLEVIINKLGGKWECRCLRIFR